MRKVTCYKADDGTIHETEQAALLHDLKDQIMDKLKEWDGYAYSKLSIDDADDLIEFVEYFAPTLRMILSALETRQG